MARQITWEDWRALFDVTIANSLPDPYLLNWLAESHRTQDPNRFTWTFDDVRRDT